MAKAAKKKAKTGKKAVRIVAKSKTATISAKSAKKAAKPTRTLARKKNAPKIDPLNRNQYSSMTPMLTVRDVRRAADFYTSAFGFKMRGIMDGPQGPVHAELRLRDTTLMLSPESRPQQSLSANTIGNTPATLYILVEDVDDVFHRALAAGAKVLMPVADMFWGDRVATIADPDGNKWMIATHKASPTEAEMREAMARMSAPSEETAAVTAGAESEY